MLIHSGGLTLVICIYFNVNSLDTSWHVSTMYPYNIGYPTRYTRFCMFYYFIFIGFILTGERKSSSMLLCLTHKTEWQRYYSKFFSWQLITQLLTWQNQMWNSFAISKVGTLAEGPVILPHCVVLSWIFRLHGAVVGF